MLMEWFQNAYFSVKTFTIEFFLVRLCDKPEDIEANFQTDRQKDKWTDGQTEKEV